MAAREFACEIHNVGKGPITRVRDHLDHGEWTGGFLPSQGTQVINPGETKTFKAESNGFLTGTQGSVTFTALTGGISHSDFLKVSFDVPFAPDPGTNYVVGERARYDPDTDRNSFDWQNRDQRPSDLIVSGQMFDLSDGNILTGLQLLPVLPSGIWWPNLNVQDRLGLRLFVDGTVQNQDSIKAGLSVGPGVIYALTNTGDLLWYCHVGVADGSFKWIDNNGRKVGVGWGGNKQIFSGGGGIIYVITGAGDLMWYRHDGASDGSFKWADNNGRKVGAGWGGNKQIFSGGGGIIYVVTGAGDLMWYRHDGISDGSFKWADNNPRKVGAGWSGFRQVFSGGGGVIYVVTNGGDLMWYRHDGASDGSFKWADNNGRKVGVGWGDHKQLFAAGNGVLYVVTDAGDLMWYRHDGWTDGSFKWADNNPRKVGTGWGDNRDVFAGFAT